MTDPTETLAEIPSTEARLVQVLKDLEADVSRHYESLSNLLAEQPSADIILGNQVAAQIVAVSNALHTIRDVVVQRIHRSEIVTRAED